MVTNTLLDNIPIYFAFDLSAAIAFNLSSSFEGFHISLKIFNKLFWNRKYIIMKKERKFIDAFI